VGVRVATEEGVARMGEGSVAAAACMVRTLATKMADVRVHS